METGRRREWEREREGKWKREGGVSGRGEGEREHI